jgi:hypothetical protein
MPTANQSEWIFKKGGRIVSSSAVTSWRVYVGSDDGHLYWHPQLLWPADLLEFYYLIELIDLKYSEVLLALLLLGQNVS